MKTNSKITAILMLLVFLFLSNSCDEVDKILNPDDDNDNQTELTLTMSHGGVDWSAGKTYPDISDADSDGETIGWCEPGTPVQGISGIWYRSFSRKVYRAGAVDLSSVTEVNTNNWATDVCSTPLKEGDVWVAETKDGYVKFKVAEPVDPNAELWKVKVSYVYSSTTKF